MKFNFDCILKFGSGTVTIFFHRQQSGPKGYKVFITRPGIVTSKIAFHIDPKYRGEHNFYLHGIHVVRVSITITIT